MSEASPGRDNSEVTAAVQGQDAAKDSDAPEIKQVQTSGQSAAVPNSIEVDVRFFARQEHGAPYTATVEYEVSDGVAVLADVSSGASFADEIRAVLKATDEVYRHPAVGEVNGIEELKTTARSKIAVKA
ncbi:hypothetical protein SAMN05216388_100979 [Halorientalis persicus]|uniref:Uncharacterized protein n=1 Tax=Halorientalis persicus TaxID=1367881 RepID=A0A1H8MQ51_9EURY|nr:hypothetical protein [Halorientalis persicus]SEO19388.1 hypothetical protein SAMN05216388_100979 [Halorientalis persicus]